MRHDPTKHKTLMRSRRHIRIRGRVRGTNERPRLSVFRSSKHAFLQLIDDETGHTIIAVKTAAGKGKTKTEHARKAAEELAAKAKARGVVKIVFDRGGYAYHGRVQAIAEGARGGGLEF